MSRKKSVRALLTTIPSDISPEVATKIFIHEGACHLRVLAAYSEKRATYWKKVRARYYPRNAWRDIVRYAQFLTEQDPGASFV